MSSKVFIFLGLVFAIVVLLSSEVAARDLETDNNAAAEEVLMTETNGVDQDEKRRFNFGGRRHHFRGSHFHGGGHGHCRHGCCRQHNGHCRECCSYAGEAVDAEPQEKPHN